MRGYVYQEELVEQVSKEEKVSKLEEGVLIWDVWPAGIQGKDKESHDGREKGER